MYVGCPSTTSKFGAMVNRFPIGQLVREPDRPPGPRGGPYGIGKELAFDAEPELPDPKPLSDSSTHWDEPAFAARGLPVCGDARLARDEPALIEIDVQHWAEEE